MKIYKVGGAVRDQLLGYPSQETDWVVVGGTPAALIDQGFRQVGKDFPVFLHPDTQEEYALARTERKSGHGYHGFTIHADPSVTLEEDLLRRDLTINAMAIDVQGVITDPYGGQDDLAKRVLRHVSPQFAEDPLRVLRVARFAARYHHLGFAVASETLELMRQLSSSGELAHLAKERIWVETERALTERDPAVYFQVLHNCGALAELIPALCVSSGMALLEHAAKHTQRTDCRWAALLADLPTDKAKLSSESVKAPNAHTLLASRVAEWRPQLKTALMSGEQGWQLLKALDALRRDEPFDGFCEAVAALESQTAATHPACQRLRAAREAAAKVKAADMDASLSGKALGEALQSAQAEAIAKVLETFNVASA